MFSSDEQAEAVYSKLIERLKESQKNRGQTPVGDAATLKRERDRAYEVNEQNAYLSKFQKVFMDNYGFDQNGKLTDLTVSKILSKESSTGRTKHAAN